MMMIKGLQQMNNLSTTNEMATTLAAEQAQNSHKRKLYNSNHYKAQSDSLKGKQIANQIHAGRETLKESSSRLRIDLSDTNAVEKRTDEFLDACEIAEVFPSVMSLSLAYGYTRQGLNQWLLSNPKHPTTDFINRAKDLFADILTNASLYGSANPIAAIFQLKNHFAHADKIEIAPVSNAVNDNDYDVKAIRARYLIDSNNED